MLSFAAEEGRFQFRVGGLALRGGRLLLHRAAGEPFWTPPGGRVEFGETAAEALVREMTEETGASIEVRQLCFVVENHFSWQGERIHEMLFLHAMDIPDEELTAEEFTGREADLELQFRWIDCLAEGVTLQPAFLPLALDPLPAFPVHVIQRGGIDA